MIYRCPGPYVSKNIMSEPNHIFYRVSRDNRSRNRQQFDLAS
jgi:hypothetical protein